MQKPKGKAIASWSSILVLNYISRFMQTPKRKAKYILNFNIITPPRIEEFTEGSNLRCLISIITTYLKILEQPFHNNESTTTDTWEKMCHTSEISFDQLFWYEDLTEENESSNITNTNHPSQLFLKSKIQSDNM